MDAKHPLRSKTIWLNVLALVVPVALDNIPILKPFMPANLFAYVSFALPIVNIVLRSVTNQPLSLGK